MAKKSGKNTKGKIISAAWQLFYERGYEDTTVDEIVEASGTSKGSFYHYFGSKDELMGTLSYMLDEKYEEIEGDMEKLGSCYEKLFFLNRELFGMIENGIDLELLSRLLSTQLITRGEKSLLDKTRVYYKLLRRVCMEGQETGEFRSDISVNELVKLYAVFERGLLYDWCICGGEYPLRNYGEESMPFLLERFKADFETANEGKNAKRGLENAEKAYKKKKIF